MKTISRLFLLIAVILSHIMCAVVAYNYCNMEWHIKVGESLKIWDSVIRLQLYWLKEVYI